MAKQLIGNKLKDYFAAIGGQGGRAGKGSAAKKASAIRAAQSRWHELGKRKIIITIDGGRLILSKEVQDLDAELSSQWQWRC